MFAFVSGGYMLILYQEVELKGFLENVLRIDQSVLASNNGLFNFFARFS